MLLKACVDIQGIQWTAPTLQPPDHSLGIVRAVLGGLCCGLPSASLQQSSWQELGWPVKQLVHCADPSETSAAPASLCRQSSTVVAGDMLDPCAARVVFLLQVSIDCTAGCIKALLLGFGMMEAHAASRSFVAEQCDACRHVRCFTC